MGAFAAGQVVLLAFPFSDLSRSKFRPALLLASVGHGDWVACQITSNPYGDLRAIALSDAASSPADCDGRVAHGRESCSRPMSP